MLDHIPSQDELRALLGDARCELWTALLKEISALYDTDETWDKGGKAWDYEYKYRRGGKTLCALYAREGRFGLMIIFGAKERDQAQALLPACSASTRRAYDEATTYHDGKWVMFTPESAEDFKDYVKLLGVKRRPNRKG